MLDIENIVNAVDKFLRINIDNRQDVFLMYEHSENNDLYNIDVSSNSLDLMLNALSNLGYHVMGYTDHFEDQE